MTSRWPLIALLAAVLAAARGQVSRSADPTSCRRYLEGPDRRSVLCPDELLFDTFNGKCMPAPVASCGTGQYH